MEPVTIIAGISAFLQATQTWMQYRDSSRAAEAFKLEMLNAPKRPEILSDAKQVADIVPPKVLETLWQRSRKCWNNYIEMLDEPDGTYTPKELDDATFATNNCVCRELKRIKVVLGGRLPPGKMQEAWDVAGCS
ncbi:hypothetical protein [Lacimicrobium alkaliphilum]|uniref:Uncharacterized protein n=1 Tax=Lacimicrobium alkaliphilum TaxID=1526571 RepID=A0A0U2Z7A6_9ALTE|nr:hypothetical protein [Lacimicrobium alkaliphilum]ALS98324.1 hypothetical protein AT746_08710 [Lacimicrobium alkaliphilum]